MFCKKCGKDLGAHPGRFCPGCGNPVEEKASGNHKLWIPALAIAAILLGAGAGIFLSLNFLSGSKGSEPANPDKMEEIQETETAPRNQLINIEVEENLYALDLTSKTAKLVYAEKPMIPPSVEYEGENYPITEIEDHGLELIMMNPITGILNPNSIQGTIEIPNTVERIGDFAFANQNGLESIQIPKSVKEIGAGAFMGCSSLRDIEIPDTVSKIGGGAFLDTQWADSSPEEIFVWNGTLVQCLGEFSEAEYEIPPEVTVIGEDAFSGQDLTSVIIPDQVEKIGAKAFAGCSNLETIELSEQVREIGGQAFALTAWAENQGSAEFIWKDQFVQLNYYPTLNNPSEEYRIPAGTKIISDYAFASLERYGMREMMINRLEMPDGVTEIGKGAFEGCGTYVSIPSSVKKIGDYAFFRSYRELRHGPMLTGKYKVVIPEGVETIGKRAFGEDYYISSITLPSTVREISQDAFSWYPDWDGYSWTLRSRYFMLSRSDQDIEFTTDDYVKFKEQVFKTYLDRFPNSMEISVPENRKEELEAFFSGRSEFDVELHLKGYQIAK